MKREIVRTIALTVIALGVVLSAARPVRAQDSAKTKYPNMAPIDQYLMADKDAEIALARSAGPDSISRDAEILVMGRHGYETAVKGKNGFVCLVERSWTAGIDDPNFWNPKLRGPLCLNAAAARTYLPHTIKKTDLILAGKSKAEMFDGLKTALDKKEIPALEIGAMSYMLSKQGYLGDSAGHWHPHLMFFVPETDEGTWGANLTGSPVLGAKMAEDQLTIFFVPVEKWSDGTADADAH